MKQYQNRGIKITCEDWRQMLSRYRDKHFDLAIVDPPYFSGPEKRKHYGAETSSIGVKREGYPVEEVDWEVPGPDYFNELVRVSKNQIVWGCNYYNFQFGPGRIVWDKINFESSYSDCEIAYSSMHDSVRLFRFMWNGMMQGKSITKGYIQRGNKSLNQARICPTEKPVELYTWILQKYAMPGFKILDTHVGSASIAMACDDLGYELTACDISEAVFGRATARLQLYQTAKETKKTLFNQD